MLTAVLMVLALAVILLLAFGAPRAEIARTPGVEGIEDIDSAKAYDLMSRMPTFRVLRRHIAAALGRRDPRGMLVDIGCGPGYLALLLAQEYPDLHVVGVDASDEMIRSATGNAARRGLSSRVEFRQGDVARLPFGDAEVDLVISTLSLHHWSKPGEALAELHRALAPGGRGMIFDLRRDSRRRYYWLLRFVTSVVAPPALRRINEPMGSVLSSYTPAEVERLLRASPFSEWEIDGAGLWMFVWLHKTPNATTQR